MVAIFTGLGAGFERGSAAALGSGGLLGSGMLGRGGESVAVNAATGNLVISRQDEFVIGKGPDVAISRTYNSLGALDDNGDYWRQSTDRRVFGLTGTVNTTGSTIKRVSADGSEITYTWVAAGSYYEATDGAGSYDRLTYNGTTQKWTWADGDSDIAETYGWASAGYWRIETQADADGNTLTFNYSSDKLVTVTTQNGATQVGYIEYTWTGNNITSVKTWYDDLQTGPTTLVGFTRTTYGYDGSNRLTSVTVDLTPANTGDSSTYVTTYTYDGTSKRIASIGQTDGSLLAITYYTTGAYTGWVKDYTQTAASGDTRVTALTYTDEANGLLRTEVTDPRGQVTKLWSKNVDAGGTPLTDERGQLMRVMAPPATTGATPTEINYTYDGAGNVLTAVTKSGATPLSTVSYQYDAAGNVSQVTDANGNVVTRQYAATTNKLLLETRTGSYTGGSGSLYTRYVYDAEEHLTFVISAEGHVTEYAYTAGGEVQYVFEYPGDAYTIGSTLPTHAQMASWRGGLNRTTSKILGNEYDARGNLTATSRVGASDAGGASITSEGMSTTYFSYDQAGKLLSRYNSAGTLSVAETFVYDGLGRVIVSTDAAGGRSTIVFNDAATTTTVMTQTTSGGAETGQSYRVVSTYNKAGELISVLDSGSATGSSFTVGGTATNIYDKNGQLRLTTDATGLRHFYLYDKAGRKIADIYADSSGSATGEIVEYRYDASGRLVATARYTNKLTTAQLTTLANPANEVEIATIRPTAHGYDIWEWNVYDTGGRVIETILGDGSVTGYEYDASDRLVKTTGYYIKLAAGTITGYITTSPTAVAWPTAHANDTVARTFYDRDGRLVGSLNAEGNLSQVIYDEAGQKIREVLYANATTTTYRASGTYDQLLSTVTLDAARDVSSRYVYDGQGLLRYTIDALNRVTETVYFTSTTSMAVGLVRKTVAYAAPLGAVANYTYATVKSAVSALASAQNDRQGWSVYNDRGQLKYAISQIRSDDVSGLWHPVGTVTRYDYDAAGLVIKTTQYAATIDMYAVTVDTPAALDTWAASNGANARITRDYYNERGELQFTVDAEGYVTQRWIDAAGRLRWNYRWSSAITVSDATLIAAVNSASKGTSVVTENRYDASGRKVDYYDGNYTRTYTGYYANGTQAWEIRAWGQGMDESRTEYRYNQAGRLVRTYDHVSELTSAGNLGASAVQVNGAQRLQSASTSYNAVVTREGELRLYHNGEVIWSNGVREVVSGATYRLVAQTDGNLVVYRDVSGQSAVAIWSTATSYAGATYLIMQDSGNLELRKGTVGADLGLVWSSGTTGLTGSTYATVYADTQYTYDGLGNVLTVIDQKAQTTTNTYDRVGRLLTTSKGGVTTTFAYDAFGHTAKTIDGLGNASYSYYDQLGRVALVVDAESYATRTTYNAFGEIATVTRYAIKATGTGSLTTQPTITTNAADAVTTFAYDKLGRLASTTDAVGGVESYTYDAFGQRATLTNKLGGVTTYTYDKLGRLLQEQLPVGSYNAAGTLVAANVINKYIYDSRGNRTQMIEAFGLAEARTTNYEYDAGDRLVRTYGVATDIATSSTAALTSIVPEERFIYDRRGNVIEKIDAVGARTLIWYDKLDRITHQLSATGTLSRSFYDKNSNRAETRVYETAVTLPADAKGLPPSGTGAYRVTRYAYDALERLIETRIPAVDTAIYSGGVFSVANQDLVTTNAYDAASNVVKTVDANGKATWLYYDKAGNQTVKIDAENYRTDWTYDADGNVLSERRYSAASATPSSTTTPPAAPATSANDRVTLFTYDKMGRRLTETRLGVKVHNGSGGEATWNSTVTYTYNALGQVLSKTEAPSLPSVIPWFTNGTGQTLQVTYGQSAQGDNAMFLRKDVPFTDPGWVGWQHGGTVMFKGGDRTDGYYSVQAGQTVKYSFATQEISDAAMRTDALLHFWDSAGAYLGSGGVTYTDNTSQFTLVTASATAPAGAAYASLEVGLVRLNTTNSGAMEIAIRDVNIDASGGPTVVSAWGDMQVVVGQTPQAENAVLLKKQIPLTDPAWTTWQYGGAVRMTGGDRADGLFSVVAGQPVSYAFEMKEISDNALRADAALEFWDASGNFLGYSGWTYTEGGSQFTSATGSATAPANAAYAAVAIWVLRLNTTNSAPIEMALRNIQIDTRGVGSLGKTSGDTVKYAYDLGGRLVTEARSGFRDVNNQWVTPTVDYFYNGLSDLARTRQRGAGGAVAAAERATTYTYGTGGRLATMTDPGGLTKTYRYDAAGRVVREEYLRDPTLGTEGVGYTYDLEGHLIQQSGLITPGATWSSAGLDVTSIQYNAFGEIAQKGLNGVLAETFSYDGAGRLWRTTSGDGTWKYLMYDKAGNQTLAIASEGTDISNQSLTSVLDLWGSTRASIATTYVDGVVSTITRYDGRNMAVEVLEPQREVNATTKYNLQTQRGYNAFGEVKYEINALGAQIDYTYNTMGRQIKIESPTVAVTSETGAVTNVRPTEYRYYDLSGRLVASRDANGNLTRMTLLAGTGYGGSQAQATEVIAADGGATRTKYDIMGDARRIEGPLYNASTAPQYVTLQSFDAMGRLTQMTRPGGLIEHYAYDKLGQRLATANSFYNATINTADASTWLVAERTTYDAQGRVTLQVAAGGDTTSYGYIWSSGIATTGLGTFGGWTKTTTFVNGKTMIEVTDQFDHAVSSTNLGGGATAFTYDKAARTTLRSGSTAYGPVPLEIYYYNTGKVSKTGTSADYEADGTYTNYMDINDYYTTFGYDKVGNLVSEFQDYHHTYTTWVEAPPGGSGGGGPEFHDDYYIYKDATATYDALGRIVSWTQATGASPQATRAFEYDANGNIRRSLAVFYALTPTGGVATSTTTQDYWYRYDALNRVVTSQGKLISSAVVRDTTGIDTVYDSAGNRKYTLSGTSGVTREDYTYDAEGRVIQVNSGNNASAIGAKRADFTFDALGRQTLQRDYDTNGTTVLYSRSAVYNNKNQVTSDATATKRSTITYTTDSTYSYTDSGGLYYLGAATQIVTLNKENGVTKLTNKTENTYIWDDSALQSTIKYTPNTAAPGTYNTTTFNYNVIGGQRQLTRVWIADGRPRNVYFVNDMSGQAVQRTEQDNVPGSGDPIQIWYRFGGKQMGYLSNDGSLDTSYVTSIANRTAASAGSGAFSNGATTGTSFADFDVATDQVNSYNQGSQLGGYTVQQGDTLNSIAANLWGDSSLWYKLAEVNGLSAGSALAEGTLLTIPAGVIRNTNSASTFRPYDPSEILGNVNPTVAPKPKKGNQCGGLGQLLMVVIAVVVTMATQGATTGFFSGLFGAGGAAAGTTLASTAAAVAGAAAAGAAGSIASQAFGVATGIQDKFSWNAVALAGIGAGVGAGLGVTNFGGGEWQGAAIRGVTGSAITQGIGMATGLQKNFSWVGVATAGIGAAVASQINIGGLTKYFGDGQFGEVLARGVAGGASAVANAAARSLLEGSDFGDNLLAALPDVIGNAIGEMIGGKIQADIAAREEEQRQAKIDADIAAVQKMFDEDLAWLDDRVEGLDVGRGRSGFLRDPDVMSADAGGLSLAERLALDKGGVWGYGHGSRGLASGTLSDAQYRQTSSAMDLMKQLAEALGWRDVSPAEAQERVKQVEFDLVDSWKGSNSRELTTGERKQIESAFGRQNLDSVYVVKGSGSNPIAAAAFLKGNPAITVGNIIYMSEGRYASDLSSSYQGVEDILHEFTHVTQYRELGVSPFLSEYLGQVSDFWGNADQMYRYQDRTQSTFKTENFEGQAAMVGDYGRDRVQHQLSAAQRADIQRRLAGTGIFGL